MKSDICFSTRRDVGLVILKLGELTALLVRMGVPNTTSAFPLLTTSCGTYKCPGLLMQQRGVTNRVGPQSFPTQRLLVGTQMTTKTRTPSRVTHPELLHYTNVSYCSHPRYTRLYGREQYF